MFNKENKLSGKDITILLLYLYFILSLIFIAVTIYDNVKVQYGEYSFQNGQSAGYNLGLQDWEKVWYTSAVTQILTESRKCQPFPINVEEQRAILYNVECNQQATSQTGQTNAQVEVQETTQTDEVLDTLEDWATETLNTEPQNVQESELTQ